VRCAVLYGPRDVRVEERPAPRPGCGEVLVRVKATTICPTDLRKYLGHSRLEYPLIPGHEFSGVVEELGEGVNSVAEGDRVTAIPFVFCEKCRYCRLGRHNLCVHLGGLGGAAEMGEKLDGSFAEYVVVPEPNVYKLSPSTSPIEGSLVEPLAASLEGLLKAELRPGDTLLVLGTGPMGLLQISLAKLMGASKIIACDLLEERLEAAAKAGADVLVDPREESLERAVLGETGGLGVDAILVSAGGTAMAELTAKALELSARGGRIVVFAGTWPPQGASLDLNLIHYGERKIVGSFIYTREVFTRALELVEGRKVELEWLVTHRLPLDEAREGFEIVKERRGLKVALIP